VDDFEDIRENIHLQGYPKKFDEDSLDSA